MPFLSLLECLKQALHALSAHKLRSVLTVLGIIVGICTTIIVTSIITGMNVRVSEIVERFGTSVAFVSKQSIGPHFSPLSKEEQERKDLTAEDGDAIKELPHVAEAVSCLGAWPGSPDAPQIRHNHLETRQSVLRGGEASFFSVRSMTLEKGRFFTETENQHNMSVAVLGYDAANALFPGYESLEKEITINGQVFRVIGVLEKSTSRGLFGGNANWEDNCAIIPLGTFHGLYPQEKNFIIVVKATSGNLDKMLDEITQLLRRRRKVPFNKPDNFEVSTAQSNVDGFAKITYAMGVVIIPIAGMGLLVGGIGVLNIMLVSVTERTKEIGVRRALGARRSDIIAQFLIEAMSLTGLGGLLGIAIGLAISWFINAFIPALPSFVSLFWVILGLVVAVAVGLISGIWPAIKAAWLDPVEALRYE